MNTARALALLLLLGLVGAACSRPADQAEDTTSPPADAVTAPDTDAGAPTAGEPDAVDVLRVGVPEDVGPINLFGQHEEPLTELVYDKLLAPSPYVEDPQPWLAEEVTAVDASTWDVRLREDVAWHDGQPFTADDVAFTIDYFGQAPTGRWTHHVDEIPDIAQVEITDARTLRLTCAFPCPELGSVTLADIPILPAHVWADVAEPREADFLPVGTGPYRLVDYNPTDGYRFEANADYFAGAPVVGELVMPIIPDPSTTFTALRTGEIDAAMRPLSPELLESFESSADIALVDTAPLQFPELRLNFERAPFDDPLVRRALSRAIDRVTLLDTVLLGQGRAATSGYPHPDSPWTNPDLSTPTDPDEARALLDDAGLADRDGDGIRETADGAPVAFTLQVTATEPTDVRMAELVAADLAAVGLDVTVTPQDAGTVGGLFRSREFDTYITTITAHGVADPDQFIMSHRSGYLWRVPEVPYPEFEALFEDWSAAQTIEERTDVSFAMQELFNRQPTSIPLAYPEVRWAYRPAAYDGWVESPGYGIVHKWSFLPRPVAVEANAVAG